MIFERLEDRETMQNVRQACKEWRNILDLIAEFRVILSDETYEDVRSFQENTDIKVMIVEGFLREYSAGTSRPRRGTPQVKDHLILAAGVKEIPENEKNPADPFRLDWMERSATRSIFLEGHLPKKTDNISEKNIKNLLTNSPDLLQLTVCPFSI